MKATIKIATASKEFRKDQEQIIKRIMSVLVAYDLSVALIKKQKKTIVTLKKIA